MSEPEKTSWTVKVVATVVKLLACADCTEEEARTCPYAHAIDEQDGETTDWEVVEVRRDE